MFIKEKIKIVENMVVKGEYTKKLFRIDQVFFVIYVKNEKLIY